MEYLKEGFVKIVMSSFDFFLDFGLPAFVIACILSVYFFPTLIAKIRNHHNATAIIVLNISGGWTIIGWIVALVWSCTSNTKK